MGHIDHRAFCLLHHSYCEEAAGAWQKIFRRKITAINRFTLKIN
jgi:hypothetical protein